MLNTVVNVIKKRPAILVFTLVITTILVFFEYNNPLISLLAGLKTSNDGYFLDALISVLKLIFNPTILVQTLIFVLIALMILAVAGGLFFSGYFYILMNALKSKAKFKGEFLYGFKILFTKTAFTFFLFLLTNVLLIIYISVCSVPAIVITRAWLRGSADYAILAISIDLITAIIVFFSLMFFRAYTIFWMPAITAGEKKFIYKTKQISKNHFWSIIKALLVFDIIFCAFNALFIFARIKNPGALLFYGASWLFYIVFFIFILTYIFSAYLRFSEYND